MLKKLFPEGNFQMLIILIALYPVLHFNLSSIALSTSLGLIVLHSMFYGSKQFNGKQIREYLIWTLFLFLLIISGFYSDDFGDANKRLTRLIPLLVIPALISFFGLQINRSVRNRVLLVYTAVNGLYVILLMGAYGAYTINNPDTIQLNELLANHNEFQIVLDSVLGVDTLFYHKAYLSMNFVILAVFWLDRWINNFQDNQKWINPGLFGFIGFSGLTLYLFSFPNVVALALTVLYVMYRSYKRQVISLQYIAPMVGIIFLYIISFSAICLKTGAATSPP